MKICIVSTAFPHRLGHGEGPFIWEMAHAVARQGHDVRVLAMHHPDAPTREAWDGVQIWRPPYWWPVSGEVLRKDVGGLPVNWRRYPRAKLQILSFSFVHAVAVARYARGCDVIHAHWTLSATAAYITQFFHRCPVVATLQGSDVFQAAKLPVVRHVTRAVLLGCSQVTVLSRALRDATVALGVSAEAIEVIPNGVNVGTFCPVASEDREPVILYVGALIKRKGVEYLVDAMSAFLVSAPHARLVLLGDGPERASLEHRAKTLGVADHVQFEGFVSQDCVKQWMQRSKVLVLPSLEEGLGVVLLEALASGTPIVASEVGGIVDVVSTDVGVLVEPRDAAAISDALKQVWLDQDWWQSLSLRARQLALDRYDWNRIANEYVEVYHRVVEEATS